MCRPPNTSTAATEAWGRTCASTREDTARPTSLLRAPPILRPICGGHRNIGARKKKQPRKREKLRALSEVTCGYVLRLYTQVAALSRPPGETHEGDDGTNSSSGRFFNHLATTAQTVVVVFSNTWQYKTHAAVALHINIFDERSSIAQAS